MENIRELLIIAVSFILTILVVNYSNKIFKQLIVKKQLKRITSFQKNEGSEEIANLVADIKESSKILQLLSNLSVPEDGWQNSTIKLSLIRAGIRNPNAGLIYYAVKSVGAILIPLIIAGFLLFFSSSLSTFKIILIVFIAIAVGYYGPDFYLKVRTKRRKQMMQETLPDLIDLLVICTESGLGLDASVNRVSREIVKTNKDLAEEFYLSSLEIRAGGSRLTALKNLALRIDIEDLSNLVSMLTQADKFGTSLAESLRIQSDVMRTRRLQRAEEMASKIPVKMLLPLVFFMFPAILIVLIGPAILSMTSPLIK